MGHLLIARIVGGISLAFGIVLAMLVIFAVERQLAVHGDLDKSVVVIVAVCSMISAFCSLAGYRLLFNRPNRNGSLLSPAGWMALTASFLAVGAALTFVAVVRREYQSLAASIGLFVLAYGSVIAGRRRRPISPVFAPETSLLSTKGFAPAGFQCGIEILNDNRTPMEFVVSVLQKDVGLSRIDATRTMLEIHLKGGVLLSLRSLEQSTRVAEAIVTEARGNNHPLVCRAVSRQ
jgi:ATP-dependent Clp protease adapter protein ClpS